MMTPKFLIRCLARIWDYFLFYLAGVLLSLFIPIQLDETFYLPYAAVVPLLWAPIEALLISTWGTTPGKMLFHMIVRKEENEKLSFMESLKRACFFRKRPGHIIQLKMGWGRQVLGAFLVVITVFLTYQAKPIDEYVIRFEEENAKKPSGGWIDYHSEEGGFHVAFPTQPEVEASQFEISKGNQLNLNEYKSTHQEGVSYAVSYMELPRKWRSFSSTTLLKGAIKVISNYEKNSILISKQFTRHKNYPALDYHFKQDEKEIQGRLVLVGSRIYRLAVIYPTTIAQTPQQDSFVNSFEIDSSS